MEQKDISGFIDDRDNCSSITLSAGANTLVRRIRIGTRWYVAKSPGSAIDPVLAHELLRKEYELLSRLSHRNIVKAHRFENQPGYGPTLIMEWIDGVPLDRYLASEKVKRADRQRLSRQLIDAMAYIHDNNITHRDLKPSNLLVDNLGNLMIIDFGLADDPASCLFKHVTGTTGFTAPELSDTSAEPDWRRADVYALGIMLRTINSGYLCRRLARRCMRVDPAARPADCTGVKATYRTMKRRLVAVIAAALAVITGLGITLLLQNNADSHNALETAFTAPSDTVTTAITEKPDADSWDKTSPGQPASTKSENTPAPGTGRKAQSPDVNFALIRAAEIRDSLRYISRSAGRKEYDIKELDRLTDRLLDLGRKAGWTNEEYSFARSAMKSHEFYAGKPPVFYSPKARSAADSTSTDIP